MLGKGQKRKRSEEEEEEAASALPSSALFSISLSKLHRSLQRGEPDLRHLVLVANTLRRIQEEMEPQQPPVSSSPRPALPPLLAPVDQLLLSGMDPSTFSSILEDLASTGSFSDPLCPPTAQPEDLLLSPEPTRPAPLDLLGPGVALLQEGLEGVFEDIDTSMYDWGPPSKEACSGTEGGRQDLPDLDYLLLGAEES
ncbi:SERTA domain-containing protein 1 [Heteronotia binoei]|uniref:SERTA domain-containing protein 1 n=1 Tax=Heteronotia binoei TaxID=13085 RepID=UPI00292D532D|nr:SERTA domain-containing protein 1 [Heteronotia binoei]